jgi:aspartate 1-decarboxylase
MLIEYLKSKIHMATITEVNPNYHGSLTLDRDLLEAARLEPNQKILVANASNGSRFETYIIEGERGSGVVGLNGPATLLGKPGDRIIVMAFCFLSPQEAREHEARVVLIREGNRPQMTSSVTTESISETIQPAK